MAYIRYKEVAKYFYFSTVIDKNSLPKYITDYVLPGETVLAAYKVGRDHGVFTENKIVLYDNSISIKPRKIILTIPYHSISSHSITFFGGTAEINLLFDSGYPMKLKFVNMNDLDKVRLRYIYHCISARICEQEIPKEYLKKLAEDKYDNKGE